MIKKYTLIVLLSGIASLSYTQEPAVQQTVEDLLESAGENMSDDANFQEILDDMERFRQHPLLINSATAEELNRLHLLSELQIHGILSYREKTGSIYSIYELASIDGFTPDLLHQIAPYLSFDLHENSSSAKGYPGYVYVKSTWVSPNVNQSKYEGSSERYYLRLKQTSAKWEYGMVAEKDPGEAFLSKSNKQGFDYTSAFVNFRIGKTANRLFAGDYQVTFGQGLVACQGFSIGKSAETSRVFKSAQGIRSYSSTDENSFFRGLACKLTYGPFTFSPFISRHRMDAILDTLDGKTYFNAFQTSGYHRTGSEITGENSLTQLAGGGHIAYSHGNWSFGFTSIYTRFNAAMDRGNEPYNQFLPSGKENRMAGIDWKGTIKNVFFFGETAIGENSGKALLAGCMFKPAANAEFSMVYRNINKTYFSYFSNAFTESARVNDEHGLYLGLKFYPAPRWIINLYSDMFKFKWIKYTTSAPSTGTESFAQLSFNPSLTTHYYLRIFSEDKEQRLITGNLKYDVSQLTDRLRINFLYDMNEQLSMNSRIEFSFYTKQASEHGFLICQDLIYKPSEKLFLMNGRIAYFNTEGYNSRIYAYENDLLYSFSIPALYGEGIRSYINMRYTMSTKFTLWFKMDATYQFAKNVSQQTVDSSTSYELKIQLRYKF